MRSPPDHPGFSDRAYRERRNAIARAALDRGAGARAPRIRYTDAEHATWSTVVRELARVHPAIVCAELREAAATIALPDARIPQLEEVNGRLAELTSFRLVAVAGLLTARAFFASLGRGRFPSTQYVRHPAMPFYTPEPDVLHELIGHAASLAHPKLAALHRAFGAAARSADDARLAALERLYWHTLEFGLVEERGRARVVGAGLLSSCGELRRVLAGPPLRPWNLDLMLATPYDPTAMQAAYFVAPSFARLVGDLSRWLEEGA